MSTEQSDRTRVLREAIVATATATSYSQRPRISKTLIAAVAAFALAGALTGGAISGVAVASTGPDSAQQQKLALVASFELQLNGGSFVGSPVFDTGQGDGTVKLGTRPAKANSVMVSFLCLDPSKYSTGTSTANTFEFSCSTSKSVSPDISTPEASLQHITTTKNTTWSVTTGRDNHWAVWISWATMPLPPQESVQQKAEVADGTVTRQEYLDAYSRYQGCLAEAGYPSLQVLDSSQLFSTGSTSAAGVANDRCYDRELQHVDELWQTQNPQIASGYSATIMNYCLTKLGQTPEPTAQGMLDQLIKLEINPIDCTPVPRD
jgi:hypothetical protein